MNLLRVNSAKLGMTPTEAIEGGFLDHGGRVLPAHPTNSERTTTMIVPVNPNLAAAMDRTSLVLGTVSRRETKLNDHDAFPELAHQLEDLAVSLFRASASLSLIGVHPMGARFDFGPDTKLSAKVNECVSYLRNDATELLKSGSFSRYESTHSDSALDRLKGLYGTLTAAIMSQVRTDLVAASERSASVLVALATTVAEAADGGRVDTTQKG